MNIIEKAIQFASKAHEGACRKGTSLPYILHPLEAASIAAQITEDPEVIAAAALHDVVEDTSFTEKDIRILFGNRVANLVMFNTEDKRRERPASETWTMRKQETISHLEQASDDEKIVAFADKLSNLRSMLMDYIREDELFWDRFEQKDPSKHVWYYGSMMEPFQKLFETRIDVTPFLEYCRLFKRLRMRVQEYKDFGRHDPKAITLIATPDDQKWVFQIKDKDEVLALTTDEFRSFLDEVNGQ